MHIRSQTFSAGDTPGPHRSDHGDAWTQTSISAWLASVPILRNDRCHTSIPDSAIPRYSTTSGWSQNDDVTVTSSNRRTIDHPRRHHSRLRVRAPVRACVIHRLGRPSVSGKQHGRPMTMFCIIHHDRLNTRRRALSPSTAIITKPSLSWRHVALWTVCRLSGFRTCRTPSKRQTDSHTPFVCSYIVPARGVHPIRWIKIRDQLINIRNLVSLLSGKSFKYCHQTSHFKANTKSDSRRLAVVFVCSACPFVF